MQICIFVLTLVLVANSSLAQLYSDPLLLATPKRTKVLNPPYFNIATGKKIDATATCGTEGPERFCKLTGGTNFEYGSQELYQGMGCDICDSEDPYKAHPVKNAIDGTERWWQSPPLSRGDQYNKVNITIDLGQVFHVAYVLIKFANSPRAGTWVLERSSDFGKTFKPWQYFANTQSDCSYLFGKDSQSQVTRDDSVICTYAYSEAVPLENGEVIVPLVKGRPGADNFSYAAVLQEWSKATNIRLRFLRTKTLLGHLMEVTEEDPTVTRRYYYSIKDISVGGRCVCNGHADRCSSDPTDQYKLKCECQHNTCGDSCEMCCPGFTQKAWRPAVPKSTNECEECNCHGHTTECVYDENVALRRLSMDKYGNFEGGGKCINCQHNTTGVNCEQCAPGFWRPSYRDPKDPYGCQQCNCDSTYTLGSCEPTTGRCYCKPQYTGDRCDRCSPGYYDFPACKQCDCYYNGTRNDACLPRNDACPCKYNFAGKYCNECRAGFFNFPSCTPCDCQGDGVASPVCDVNTGYCQCESGFTGPECRQCAPGFYNYPFCQRCACSDVGTTDQVCDSETGQCFCDDRYTGNNCDSCKAGYFGFPYCEECQCNSRGSINNECDADSGQCVCKPNYRGDSCDSCAAEHYGYPDCHPCLCNVRGSVDNTCDEVTGQCVCHPNIGTRDCHLCLSDFFNFPRCEECSCNEKGIKDKTPGECLAFTDGQCDCKENVMGMNCDQCAPLYYDINRSCISCNCFVQGTLDGVGECDTEDGNCFCKPYTCTKRCSQCKEGFYGLAESNYLGCSSCKCDIGGSMSEHCDTNSGKCKCRRNLSGRRCNKPKAGYYFASLHNIKREFEDGYNEEDLGVRFAFDQSVFPGFSMRGYTVFNYIQRVVIVPVNVPDNGLHRLLFRYQNNRGSELVATVTVIPQNSSSEDGVEQSYSIRIPVNVGVNRTSSSTMYTVPATFVLNRGRWEVKVEAEEGLMLDYLVLLPSDYYEPKILQQSVSQPCKPTHNSANGECIMFTHPVLMHYSHSYLNDYAPPERIENPSTAHSKMVLMDSSSEENGGKLDFEMRVPSNGAYVIVLEYVSNKDELQEVTLTFTSGSNVVTSNIKIFSCPYSFVCRQVALEVVDSVQIFDFTQTKVDVTLQAQVGQSFYVVRAFAIPVSEWSMTLVEPAARCVTNRGSEFDQCLSSTYPLPPKSIQIEITSQSDALLLNGDARRPSTILSDESALVYLDGATRPTRNGPDIRTTLTVMKNLPAGRYVFLIHYYNPDYMAFMPDIIVESGVTLTASSNISFCPHANGCRSVIYSYDNSVVFEVTSQTTTLTISVPQSKAFWIEYILAVPESIYNPSLFEIEAIDKAGDFLKLCKINEEQNGQSESDFCEKSTFSLSVKYNNRAFRCDCSGAGTIGGADQQCEVHGGQCPCKENVIGRRCEECMIGYFGFPNCRPCECGDLLCDDEGKCICPPNTLEPDCTTCKPYTHSYDVVRGCADCDCNLQGIRNASTDLACDQSNGQCKCRENVTGQKCDQCAPGFYGFPNCQKCTCDSRGSVSDGCDPITGQCSCKKNVDGLRCDRCKEGSFHLDELNEHGCLECFCFDKSNQCHFSQFPASEIAEMSGWNIIGLNNDRPNIVLSDDKMTIQTNIPENGGANPNKGLYWEAPDEYLKDRIASYGGELSFARMWTTNTGRGDSAVNSLDMYTTPSGSSRRPDVILKNQDYEVGYEHPNQDSGKIRVNLSERNFRHLSSGEPVTRPEMMRLLNDLDSIMILATPYRGVSSVSISNVGMETTDYDLPIGSDDPIPGVEECICPEGYKGHSCQLCAEGHFRDKSNGGDGICKRCDCYPNCNYCDDNGKLMNPEDCLHNTGGEDCQQCKEGFYGNTTDGVVSNCQPCPCPFATSDGSFADSCAMVDGELFCACQEGYSGPRCDQCAVQYFGNPAVLGGTCEPCNCHGNLDPNLVLETCDTLTGECSDCLYNTGGKYCERCADGFYGDAVVRRNCRECNCQQCGTEVCDHKTGSCSCKSHVVGSFCDRCEPGYYGFESCEGCKNCACAEASLSDICDETSGQCQCAPNVVGLKCDSCAPGFYNYGPGGCQPCKCRNNGPCNPVDGACTCPPGITGRQCNECEQDRFVLKPGETECKRCGKCTDDLLDEIEPLTVKVKKVLVEIANISVGVFAHKRLERLQERAVDAKDILEDKEDQMANAFDEVSKLSTKGDSLEEAIEASGIDISDDTSSGVMTGILLSDTLGDYANDVVVTPSISNFTLRMVDLSKPVSHMCNATEHLVTKVDETEQNINELHNKTKKLTDETKSFIKDVIDLLESLRNGSAENEDKLKANLKKTELLIEKMKDMNLDPEIEVAKIELDLANSLLKGIEKNFTEPVVEIGDSVQKVLDDLDNRHDKLRELRNKLNNAQEKTNMARDQNAINQKNLTTIFGLYKTFENEFLELNTMTQATASQINSSMASFANIAQKAAELGPLDTAVRASIESLEPFQTLDKESLENKLALAEAHVQEIKSDVDALAAIKMTKSDATEVANRYRNITQSMKKADEAADIALEAARNASANVESQNFEKLARKAHEKSKNLLAKTSDMQNIELKNLTNSMQDTQNTINRVVDNRDNLTTRINNLEKDIEDFDTGDFKDKHNELVVIVNRTLESATDTLERARKIEEDLDDDVDTTSDVTIIVSDIQATVDKIEPTINRVEGTFSEAKNQVIQVNRLRSKLQLDDKLGRLRKKIENARQQANMIKTSMQFNATNPERVKLRMPRTIVDTANSMSVKLTVKVVNASNNHLLLVKDNRVDGDYIRLDTEGGILVYTFKVASGIGEIRSNSRIDNSLWHIITASRVGNKGELQVQRQLPSADLVTEKKTAYASSNDQVAKMSLFNIEVYIGGFPGESDPSGNKITGSFCVENLFINQEPVGTYNFEEREGPKPAKNCRESVSGGTFFQSWRFSGINSYLRYGRSNLTFNTDSRSKAHIIGFRMNTNQANGLLFVVGTTVNQFMAMEIVESGLRLVWNFGFDEPKNATMENYRDVSSSGQLFVKAGYVLASKLVAVSINSKIEFKSRWEGDYVPDFRSDVWIGGSWCDDVPDELERHIINLRTHYRGCMADIEFNRKQKRLRDAIENIGVSLGCEINTVEEVNLNGKEYIAITSGLHSAQNGSGGFTFCPRKSFGTILYQNDTLNFVVEELEAADIDYYDQELPLKSVVATKPEIVEPPVVTVTTTMSTTTTTTAKPEPEEDEEDPDFYYNRELGRQEGLPDDLEDLDDDEEDGGINELTVIIGVIVCIVLVSLLAAVISAMRNASTAANMQPPTEAEEPLNYMQEQQAAQIEW